MTVVDAINAIYTTNDEGMFEGFMIEDVADYMGVTVDEAEQSITDAVNDGRLFEEMGDLYDPEERREWERVQDEESEYAEQERFDAWQGYMTAAGF